MLLTAGISLTVIACGTLYRRASLVGGGGAVARSVGGREVLPNAAGFYEKRLLNIVEEVALASGVPVPRVFVLEDEPGINAFAAGFTLQDAAVAVTRGALEKLKRDELQGVVAHEFSHILNGDMRLNSWLIGILFGILVTSVLGRELMLSLRHVRISGGKKGGAGGFFLVVFLSGLALWVIGSVGVFFARLIQCSVSRQREFLADASAVQFTRNPMGLAGALKRIGALNLANAMRCSNRSELSHLLFSSTMASGFDGVFASHPPLMERIRQLDPAFSGDFSPWRLSAAGGAQPQKTRAETPADAKGLSGDSAIAFDGRAMSAHLAQLSQALRESLTQPAAAAAALYALLLSEDDEVRQRQRARIMAEESTPMAASAERWRESLRGRDRMSRRMIADLAVEGARHREPAARAGCLSLCRELMDEDGTISLFEYMLYSRMKRTLSPQGVVRGFYGKPLPPARVKAEVATVLGVMAYAGQPQNDALAEAAWRAGAARATSFAVGDLLPVRESCTFDALDCVLPRLDGLAPLLKGELLTACSFVMRADGTMTTDETELLRALADMLDMPLPLNSGDRP